MNAPKRSRARVLTPEGLKKLQEWLRSHEAEENAGFKYTLERLGMLTGLDPETVKNVLDCKGSDKRTIARCFESFGLRLEDSDHIPAVQASAALSDPNFVGRDEAIADLNALVSRNAKVIVIQAKGGVGKTTLARKYLQQEFGSFLEFPIAKETKDIASIEGLIEEKLRQLGEEPGREFLVSLDRLKRKLQAERIGILIDNLEPALDSAGKFIEAHRRYVELLRVLSDPTVQSITLITSRERLREADITVQNYPLRSLNVQAWEQFFQSRSINTETPALTALHHAYGGNAKAVDILSGSVLEDFSGNTEAYWQANKDDLFIERDLEDLVTKQFDRLQQHDLDAYQLLCRMGCYRYQDVPAVPIEGLFCLLWDVPENRHRRVVKSLQDRSLVDCEDGEFWLHPVIRAEAITKLRIGKDWEVANYRAADFWAKNTKTIQTIKDAIGALEAYFHYENLADFKLIGNAIQEEIRNKRQNTLPYSFLTMYGHLGGSFYMLGEPKYVESLLGRVLDGLKFKYSRSKICHISGDFYRLSGQIKRAIELYEISRKEAIECLGSISEACNSQNPISLQLKWLEMISWFDVGLCKLDLWELEEAIQSFEMARSKTEYYNYDGTLKHKILSFYTISSFLIYTESLLNHSEEIICFAREVYNELLSNSLGFINSECVLMWLGDTYKNLGDIGVASEIYQKTIIFADQKQKPLIKSRALRGLAELNRKQRNFAEAFVCHSTEIRLLLENRGTKCDRAEAYYQLGLTYQAMGDAKSSQESFQKAIQLFSEIEAPKQVERVRRSMQNSK